MRRVTTGILLGGILITAAGVLFRMGRVSEDSGATAVAGDADRANRLTKLQPRFDGPVDLLGLLDPAKDAVSGTWRIEGAALVCKPAKTYVRLQIPCAPPAEYDLEATVERKGPSEALVLGLVAGGRQFLAHFDGKLYDPKGALVSPICTTLRLLDGQSRNEALFPGPILKEIGSSTIVCSIRSTGVQVRVDGLKVLDFQGDLMRLSVPNQWKIPAPRALFLGAYDCEYRFTKLTLRPVTP
jgi:hypothetical protein